jgi:hypothetical protein
MTEKRGLIPMLRKIHARHVIWVLFMALISVLLFVGNDYSKRLEATEEWVNEQNGHLKKIDADQKSVIDMLDEIRIEQKEQRKLNEKILIQQTKLTTDIHWLKKELDK